MQAPTNGIIFAGTRPEIIKLAPVYFCAKENGLDIKFCFTGQQFDLGWEMLNCFKISPEISFNTMERKQSLTMLSSKLFLKIEETITEHKPKYIIVQGDTTTVFCASTVGFYNKIDVLHVEAGLRTNNISHPFPEEFNRIVCSIIANYHFAVDRKSYDNLIDCKVPEQNIEIIGNTVVDSLKMTLRTMGQECHLINTKQDTLVKMHNKRFAVVTLHRRETIGSDYINSILKAFIEILPLAKNYGFQFLLVKHPNPMLEPFYEKLCSGATKDLFVLIEPLNYSDFVKVLVDCDFVITDSGGICEEACTLSKPIVCIRKESERLELESCKNYFLTGYHPSMIKECIVKAMEISITDNPVKEISCAAVWNTNFGSGNSSQKIIQRIIHKYKGASTSHEAGVEIFPAKKTILYRKIIRVFGLGYVGLPTAILLASAGFYVIGIEIDPARVESILNGTINFLSNELQERLSAVLKSGAMEVLNKSDVASDFNVVCVPTPLHNNSCDLSAIQAVCGQIAQTLTSGAVIIVESTVAPGSCQEMIKKLEELSGLVCEKDFYLAYCPERVLPGAQMLFELENNTRVIGCESTTAFELAASLYSSFCAGQLKRTSIAVAEMVKLVENSSRNMAIAFANEVFEMAKTAGVCPSEVISLANEHPRVKILNPGIGVGGHCIAVDPQFLIDKFSDQTILLATAFNANEERVHTWINRIAKETEKIKSKKTRRAKVLLLGLAYKPDVPDLRESPALKIAHELAHKTKVDLQICEPNLQLAEIADLGFVGIDMLCLEEAIVNSDLCVVLVSHKQFKTQSIIRALKFANVIDPVGILCEFECCEKRLSNSSQKQI